MSDVYLTHLSAVDQGYRIVVSYPQLSLPGLSYHTRTSDSVPHLRNGFTGHAWRRVANYLHRGLMSRN